MRFLIANKDSTADIYGHTYILRSADNPRAGLKDILVADNGSASELLRRHKGILSTADFECNKVENFPKPLEASDDIPPNSKIILLRSGGIGDHIMLLPAIKALKERLSDRSIRIWVSVQKDMFPIFQENNDIDRLYPLPLLLSDVLDADYIVDFSGSLKEALNSDMHLTDFFIQTLHLDPDHIPIKRGEAPPKLSVSLKIMELFRRLRIANPNHTIVLLNWSASTHIKSLPPYLFSEVTNKSKNIIFLIIHPEPLTQTTDDELLQYNVRAINLSSQMKSLRDYFTAVSLSDAIICSDTSTYHISSLYDKPSLVITGPTHSILTKYYPNCTAIEARYHGTFCTSPCGRVQGTCPEAQQLGTSHSPCLMSISESIIHDKFQDLVDNFYNNHVK